MRKDTLKENAKQETLELFPVKGKAVELQYSGEKVSTDGGPLILKGIDNQINIIKGFTKTALNNNYLFAAYSQQFYAAVVRYEIKKWVYYLETEFMHNSGYIKTCV